MHTNDNYQYGYQKYLCIRVADTNGPTDGYSTSFLHDYVETETDFVKDLQFDDWDLRQSWIAGEITFSYSLF